LFDLAAAAWKAPRTYRGACVVRKGWLTATVLTVGVVLAAMPCPVCARDEAASHPDWEAVRLLERSRRWAELEAAAVDLVAQLEAAAVPDSSAIARALLYRASAAWEQRRHGQPGVVEALERSIALQSRSEPDAAPRLPWSHVLAARMLHDLARAEAALRHARAASGLLAAADRPDSAVWADAELYVGLSCASLARHDEARRAYERSLALQEARLGPQNPYLVPTLAEYAMMLVDQGAFADARALLDRAQRLAADAAVESRNFLMETLARRSTLEARAGNLAESIELAELAAEKILQRWGAASAEYARARVRLAYRLGEFGDLAGEARVLRGAVPVLDAALGCDHPHTINARLAWVSASLEVGDTATVAVELVVARRALAAETGTVNRNQLHAALLESRLALLRGDHRTARAHARAVLDQDAPRRDASGRSQAAAIGAILRTCNGPDDRPLIVDLGGELDRLAAQTSIAGTRDWIEVMVLRSRAEAAVGMRDRAWRTALEIERQALDWFRYEVQALPDVRALQLSLRAGETTDLLVGLARHDDPTDVLTAWDRLVRWRGLVAREIARRRPAAGTRSDATLDAAHALWVDAQRRLARRVVTGSLHPTDTAAVAALDSAKAAAEAAERRYVRAARGAIDDDRSVSLDAVRASLTLRQTLVGFARGDDGSGQPTVHAFVATADRALPVAIRLGALAEIERAVAAWRQSLVRILDGGPQAADEVVSRRLGDRVRRLVWDPVAAVVGDAAEILLVPEGPLLEIPWLALPVDDGRYLAEEPYVLRVLNAERELLRSAPARGGGGLLAIGGPDFDAGLEPPQPDPFSRMALRSTVPCLMAGDIVLEDLPASRQEVAQIAAMWSVAPDEGPVMLLVGANADERTVKELAPGHAILHLATHGVVIEDGCARATAGATAGAMAGPMARGVGGLAVIDGDAPGTGVASAAVSPWIGRRVWLALAGANRAHEYGHDENDGLLTAEEIVTLDLRDATWVVLSACDAGIGEAWAREGMLGLRRAFHLAGARAVIASRWPVFDESAREWMDALYRARLCTTSAGAAVQAACRAVLDARRAEGRSTDPFHWAAFAATGD
jgi:CHAT domain-containing protein/tetratricopeptide (TPR) repeat protein